MRLRPLRWVAAGLLWLALSGAIALVLFLSSSRTVQIASHESRIQPDLSGEVVVRTGPLLPDVRLPSPSRIGLRVELGKTTADSVDALTTRYVAIATQPDGQIALVRREVRSMLLSASLRGAALAALPLLLWAAVGPVRRRELAGRLRTRRGLVVAVVLLVLATAGLQPWRRHADDQPPERWLPIADYLGPQVTVPEEARDLEVLADSTTTSTRAVLQSAIRAYHRGLHFYSEAETRAASLALHQPAEDETVVLLLADRHDNVDMDGVVRAIGEAGGATAVIDAGDDTSAGDRWEAFSLDSLDSAFSDLDHRWAVAGNHDHGSFVRAHLSDRGWTYFSDKPVAGPDGSRIYGADDPRSSGLGNWRDMYGSDFASAGDQLADRVCGFAAKGERVTTLVVHDPAMGQVALDRGCVDLVVAGHIHVEEGPTAVTSADGHVGHRFVVGTAGGAAYAIALGSKLRRPAGIALLTYRDGHPVGIQGVTLHTNGQFVVDGYARLQP